MNTFDKSRIHIRADGTCLWVYINPLMPMGLGFNSWDDCLSFWQGMKK
jgi:hypothetical protein